MRPLLLPGLLDAARDNAAHGIGRAGAVRVSRTSTARDGDLSAPEGSPEGAPPAEETPPPGRPADPGRARLLAPRARARGLLRRQGAGRGRAAPPPGWSWRSPPRRTRAAFLHPGRAAVVHAGVVELGWIGELHPLVARAWDLEGGAAFELDFDAIAAAAPQVEQFADVTSFPAVLQDIAVVVRSDMPAGDVRAVVRVCGWRTAPDRARCSTSTRASSSVKESNRSRSAAGVPRPRSHADRRAKSTSRERVSRRRSQRSWEDASVHRVAVIGAAGYGGALGAGIVQRHPAPGADRGHRAQRRRQAPRRALPASTGSAWSWTSSTPTGWPSWPTPRWWPTRTRPPPGAVRALRERGLKVVDLSADFRLAQDAYEHWYQPHEAPELLGEAVYGLPEITGTASRSAAPTSWPARAATPPPRCWACGRCASTCATPSWTSRPACPARAARPPRRPTTCRRPTT